MTFCWLFGPNCYKAGHTLREALFHYPAGRWLCTRLGLRDFNGRWHHRTLMNHSQTFGLAGTQCSSKCLLTLFIEVEVLEALVEVAGAVYSSDVGVGVDWSQARDGRAVPNWGLVALLWRKTQRGTYFLLHLRKNRRHDSRSFRKLAAETVLKAKSTTCSVGWWLDRIVLLFFNKLEGHCAEVALILDHQVTERDNKLLSTHKKFRWCEFDLTLRAVHIILCCFKWAHTFTTMY